MYICQLPEKDQKVIKILVTSFLKQNECFSETSLNEAMCGRLSDIESIIKEAKGKIVGGHKEKRRQAIIAFLVATDPNGCYTDDDNICEFGEVISYETAEKYFIWYANQFDKSLETAEEAVEIITAKGGYYASLACIAHLAILHGIDNQEVLRSFYRRLWDVGCIGIMKEA